MWLFRHQTTGTIYCIPLKAETILCIRPQVGADPLIETIGNYKGMNKWEGGVMGPEGRMYCMPLNHKAILRIAAADFDPTVAFMRGKLKASGNTNEIFKLLKSGAAATAVAILAGGV